MFCPAWAPRRSSSSCAPAAARRRAAAPKPTSNAIGGFVVLPPAKACVKRRRLKVALRSREGFPVRRVAIAVKGKRVALRRGSKVTGTLTLRRLPRGRYKVVVTVTLADGTVVRGNRTYRACS